MNFGAEGERILEMRQKQKQQYREDLLKQIQEHRERSGRSWASDDSSFVDQLQSEPPRHSVPPISQKQKIPDLPAPPATQDAQKSLGLHLTEPPKSANTPTKTDYDVSRFPTRLQAVETAVSEMASELQTVTRVSSIMPQIDTELANLKQAVDQAIAGDARQRARDLDAAFRRLRRDIDDAQYSSHIDGLDTEARDVTLTCSDLQSKVSDFESWSERWLSRLTSDQSKVTQQMNGLEERIRGLEARKSGEPVSRKNDDFDKVARGVAERFGKLQDDTFGTMQSTIEGLAQEIRNEGHQRASLIGQMQKQSADLHQNTVESLAKFNLELKSMSTGFGEALNSLTTSISQAFEQTQTETDAFVEDVNGRVTTLVTDAEENFKAIHSEVVETVKTMKENATSAFQVLEATTESEAETRKRNTEEILRHYHGFEDLIMQEAQLVRGTVKEKFAGIVNETTALINETTEPLEKGISTVNSVVQKLDRIEMAMQQCENVFKDMNMKVAKEVTTLTEKHKEIAREVTQLSGITARGCSDLEERLGKLEGTENGSPLALSSDVHARCGGFVQTVESHVDQLEKQLGMLLMNVGGLTMDSGESFDEDVQFVFEPSLESRDWVFASGSHLQREEQSMATNPFLGYEQVRLNDQVGNEEVVNQEKLWTIAEEDAARQVNGFVEPEDREHVGDGDVEEVGNDTSHHEKADLISGGLSENEEEVGNSYAHGNFEEDKDDVDEMEEGEVEEEKDDVDEMEEGEAEEDVGHYDHENELRNEYKELVHDDDILKAEDLDSEED